MYIHGDRSEGALKKVLHGRETALYAFKLYLQNFKTI